MSDVIPHCRVESFYSMSKTVTFPGFKNKQMETVKAQNAPHRAAF